MASPFITHQPDELVVRQKSRGLLLVTIVATIGFTAMLAWLIDSGTKLMFRHVLFLVLIGGSAAYAWYRIVDSRIKLVINKEGIWLSKKTFLPWNIIEAYHFEKRISRTINWTLWLETTGIGVALQKDITYLDASVLDITKAIEINTRHISIRYSGITEREH